MPALIPNSPGNRFEWVIRQLWEKPLGKPEVGDTQETYSGVVLDTFAVTISLVGAEGSVRVPDVVISHDLGELGVGFSSHELSTERIQRALDRDSDSAREAKAMLKRLGHPYEYNDQGVLSWGGDEWGLASLVLQVIALPEHSRADFLIPWVARELATLAKEVMKEEGSRVARRDDYHDAVYALVAKAPAIAQWAKEARVDIGKVNLATALEAIKTYRFKTSLVEQGTVVYRFDDDWTVQELRTERALEQEGKNMQNCVGGYCEDVDRGDVRIYSLRDVGGNPHVTMELHVPAGPSNYGSELSPEEFVKSEKRLRWHFAQILGKQNDAPIESYLQRVRDFIDKVFDKEGIGWCVAGGNAKAARFSGRQMERLRLLDILHTNHVGNDVFAGADFSYANLAHSSFTGLVLEGASFEAARLMYADFTHVRLYRARFERAVCHFAGFQYAHAEKAVFDGAHLGAADFSFARLDEASFRDAKVDGTKFENSDGGDTANWDGADLNQRQRKALGVGGT